MYHSITFSRVNYVEQNTWEHWHLIPTSRPFFNPPEVKEKHIEVPGSNKTIDLCDAITGYPLYENRTGKIEFIIDNGHESFEAIYSKIIEYMHGHRLKAVLEDDPGYYYYGRFMVDEPRNEANWTVISLSYNVNPYKLRVTTTTDDWLWDPFNFETDIIQQYVFNEIAVNGSKVITFPDRSYIGRKPVCPEITVDSRDGNGIRVWLHNEELQIQNEWTLQDGTTTIPGLILSKVSATNVLSIVLNGNGTISFDFRSGGL